MPNQGKLVTMAAGDSQVFEVCRDIFQAYSKKIVYVGAKLGQGQMLKAVNQMLVGIHIAAAAEAVSFSESMGIDPQVLQDTISECAGNSNMFQSRVPKLMKHDFSSRAALKRWKRIQKFVLIWRRRQGFRAI